MTRFRATAVVASTVLGVGITVPSIALADSSPGDPAHPTATVTQNGQEFTVTLPGVGAASFTVDPISGVISNVMVSVDPGFSAPGSPIIRDDRVLVRFVSATGGVDLLKSRVSTEDGRTSVNPEVEEAHEASEAQTHEHQGDGSDEAVAQLVPEAPTLPQAGDGHDANGQDEADATPPPSPQPTMMTAPPSTSEQPEGTETPETQPGSEQEPAEAPEMENEGDGGGTPVPTQPTVVTTAPTTTSQSTSDGGGQDGSSSDGGQQQSGNDGSTGGDHGGSDGGS